MKIKKRMLVVIPLLFVLLILGFGAAQPNLVPATNTKSAVPVNVVIPVTAVQVADNVFSLGSALDNGRKVEGYLIVHKAAPAKPPNVGGGKGGTTCSAPLAKGARWKATELYVLNTTNTEGMSDAFVSDRVASSLENWDSRTSFDVFGVRNTTSAVDGPDTVSPDNKNEFQFGSISEPGVIAVTIVWGIFYGPPFGRELVEWDQVYDQVDFEWGDATLNASLMDLENIVVHELGHSLGLADIYDSGCAEVTMYGYGTEGETKKRTLEPADIQGVVNLYGS